MSNIVSETALIRLNVLTQLIRGFFAFHFFANSNNEMILQSQRFVRVYHLQRQELVKKLMSGVKWISSMDVHPQGQLSVLFLFHWVSLKNATFLGTVYAGVGNEDILI